MNIFTGRMDDNQKLKHKASLEAKHGLELVPEEKRAMLYGIAWEYGHLNGLNEVELFYSDLAPLVLL